MALMDLYCKKCSLQFDKKIIFDMHLNIVHKEKINIKEEPDETRKKAPVSCEICCKTFSKMANMKKHVASVHEKKKPFKCNICDYSFTQKAHLASHVASLHERKKPFKCEIC
jgi:uncharacterized Zn-finger protein